MMSSGDGGSGDFDLNLAPIIDCFTVLITYLLVSASFISLTAFDVGVAATGTAAPSDTPTTPPYSLALFATVSKQVDIKITGGPKGIDTTVPVPPREGVWDIDGLMKLIKQVESKYKDIKEVNLSAEPQVKYKDLMRIIEHVKSIYPKVFLGG